MDSDVLSRHFYRSLFKDALIEASGSQFQVLFERLMKYAYGSDFVVIEPWGKMGDKKCDGFLRSRRCLFQVYGPGQMTAQKTIAKIEEDFYGALDYWQVHFTEWVFVINLAKGLPPQILETLLGLEKKHPNVEFEIWTRDDLFRSFDRIPTTDLVAWFGPCYFSAESFRDLGLKDIVPVLKKIAAHCEVMEVDYQAVEPVPVGKIEANALSAALVDQLKSAFKKTRLVDQFFRSYHDPEYGNHLAKLFRGKYQSLKNGRTSDEIFLEMQVWVGGSSRGKPSHEAAVMTVMAYFFERCDIFEAPRGA